MVCPQCGEYLSGRLVQSEVGLLIHRLLKHQPPAVQALVTIGTTVGVSWLLGELLGGRPRSR